ncbi:Aste57867_17381 [Aphanomyces stellatus]|uniref:Aste57867_17381 protein n=1 Tax=Aphanomyces stellatus TaxID=120398 RepID=A0A485L9A8_9STRA|nr:hypothetical protein As57867_017321 [Aphanomyces stellatus]VFT94137.1 Aste57867_17381 [Aphanomyces stellatus]
MGLPDGTRGVCHGVLAYTIWGLCPLYWTKLADVPAIQLIGHRIVWSLPCLVAVLAATNQLGALVVDGRTLGLYVISSALLGASYFICVWAVNAGFIVDLSLGMYINPLVSVLLGVVFCRETLTRYQWVAIGLATAGMLVMAVDYGKFPWIALSIALDFGLYGLVAKKAPLTALQGVTIEFSILALPLTAYLVAVDFHGTGAFGHTGLSRDVLMIGLGLLTVVPQVLFCASAQMIPLSVLGILQFVGPTISVLLGIFVYHESFGSVKAVSFCLVWLGLVLFTVQSYRHAQGTLPTADGVVVVALSMRESAVTSYANAVDADETCFSKVSTASAV